MIYCRTIQRSEGPAPHEPSSSRDAHDRGRGVHQGRDRPRRVRARARGCPEVALAAQLETSRGTVREALRTLADGGLIQIIPRRGVFVSQLSVRATWEITSLRALLEPYASRLALEASGIGSRRSSVRSRRRSRSSRWPSQTGDPVTVADADVAFHRAVFARCGHEMLLSQLDDAPGAVAADRAHQPDLVRRRPDPHRPARPDRRGRRAPRPGAARGGRTHPCHRGRRAAHDAHGRARARPVAHGARSTTFGLGRWPIRRQSASRRRSSRRHARSADACTSVRRRSSTRRSASSRPADALGESQAICRESGPRGAGSVARS